MGYELHITRRDDWWEDGPDIGVAEWRALIDADPDLRRDGEDAIYRPDRDDEAWFCWVKGNIDLKRPDSDALAKMLQLAKALDARVQGDEGELYDDPAQLRPAAVSPAAAPLVRSRPWWKLW